MILLVLVGQITPDNGRVIHWLSLGSNSFNSALSHLDWHIPQIWIKSSERSIFLEVCWSPFSLRGGHIYPVPKEKLLSGKLLTVEDFALLKTDSRDASSRGGRDVQVLKSSAQCWIGCFTTLRQYLSWEMADPLTSEVVVWKTEVGYSQVLIPQ